MLLDEIGVADLRLQLRLLHVLQERELEGVRGSKTVWIDVRVIVATNADLHQEIRKISFREDLFYRLNVVPLRIPPLLIESFMRRLVVRDGVEMYRIEREVLDYCLAHP